MDITIDTCGADDHAAVVDIYNHYIETSHATFDVTPFSLAARSAWFAQFQADCPYRLLVAKRGAAVLGFCCSTAFKSRPAYRQSVETTVYLCPSALRQGVGRLLYSELFAQLGREKLHRAYAAIALPNAASVKLHEAFGFKEIGVCTEVGFKFERYWDVAMLEKCL